MPQPKIIVILGPTASGKTDLGLALAKEFNGEVVSADSRQIYKKMNIGTAKPEGQWKHIVIPTAVEGSLKPDERDSSTPSADSDRNDKTVYVVSGVPHHLMDIIDPGEDFSLADYKEQAIAAINDILSRGKLPIIVGGTGLYIRALVDNFDIPKIEPNKKLRQQLEKKSLPQLAALLKKIDLASAQKIDLKNPRRVLRALEVFILSGESFFKQRTKSAPLFNVLQIGINLPRPELFERIDHRVDEQLKNGLVEETAKLAKQKYGWHLPSMSGIGYKQIGFYLREEMTLPEAVELLKRDSRRYAKRQTTWFNKDKKIHWLKGADFASARQLVKIFLNK